MWTALTGRPSNGPGTLDSGRGHPRVRSVQSAKNDVFVGLMIGVENGVSRHCLLIRWRRWLISDSVFHQAHGVAAIMVAWSFVWTPRALFVDKLCAYGNFVINVIEKNP